MLLNMYVVFFYLKHLPTFHTTCTVVVNKVDNMVGFLTLKKNLDFSSKRLGLHFASAVCTVKQAVRFIKSLISKCKIAYNLTGKTHHLKAEVFQ